MTSIRRVRTVFSGVAGTPWYSNFYFTLVNGTVQDHLDLVGAFWGAVDARIIPDVTWETESDVAVIDDATGQLTGIETGTGPSGVGSQAGIMLPASNQALVHWLTGSFLNGRQLRGRCFIPGLTETDNDAGGTLSATAQSVIQAAADALVTNSATPGPLRVFSKSGFTSATVSSADVPTKWAVLRSRRD